jgi:hypothetical protein
VKIESDKPIIFSKEKKKPESQGTDKCSPVAVRQTRRTKPFGPQTPRDVGSVETASGLVDVFNAQLAAAKMPFEYYLAVV